MAANDKKVSTYKPEPKKDFFSVDNQGVRDSKELAKRLRFFADMVEEYKGKYEFEVWINPLDEE